jgi:hypothetical protein
MPYIGGTLGQDQGGNLAGPYRGRHAGTPLAACSAGAGVRGGRGTARTTGAPPYGDAIGAEVPGEVSPFGWTRRA